MSGWDQVREKINNKGLKQNSWKSDQKYLLRIIDYAEEFAIDPEPFIKISISNFRTIVKVARKAIVGLDTKRLVEIFTAAAAMPTSQLRVYVGAHDLELIKYQEILDNKSNYVNLVLTLEQFIRISNSVKARYFFEKKDKNQN